jgi:endonuclease YncB( thermonuclease family)
MKGHRSNHPIKETTMVSQYDNQGEFAAAETDARERRRGGADPNPTPPWEWRKAKRQASKSTH